MKRLELFYLSLFCVLLLNNSCTQSDEQINNGLNDGFTNSTKVNYQVDSTNKIVMIYDYDAELSKLQYRPVKIQNPTGDYLKDALQAFIDHNHFLETSDSIRIEKIEKNNDQTTLYFSGLALSDLQKDKRDFFKKALELTIARNFHERHIKIILNEDFP